MSKKKKTTEKKARVHEELQGFEIKINPLGEITSNYDIDQINKFLDKNVYDKKLSPKEAAEDEEAYPIQEAEDTNDDDPDFLKSGDDDEEEVPRPKGRK